MSQAGVTTLFRDASLHDFRLAAADTTTMDAGADLSDDPDQPFADDVEGQARIAPWDVGADEK